MYTLCSIIQYFIRLYNSTILCYIAIAWQIPIFICTLNLIRIISNAMSYLKFFDAKNPANERKKIIESKVYLKEKWKKYERTITRKRQKVIEVRGGEKRFFTKFSLFIHISVMQSVRRWVSASLFYLSISTSLTVFLNSIQLNRSAQINRIFINIL